MKQVQLGDEAAQPGDEIIQLIKIILTKSRSESDDGSASDDHNAKAFENMDASSQELNK